MELLNAGERHSGSRPTSRKNLGPGDGLLPSMPGNGYPEGYAERRVGSRSAKASSARTLPTCPPTRALLEPVFGAESEEDTEIYARRALVIRGSARHTTGLSSGCVLAECASSIGAFSTHVHRALSEQHLREWRSPNARGEPFAHIACTMLVKRHRALSRLAVPEGRKRFPGGPTNPVSLTSLPPTNSNS